MVESATWQGEVEDGGTASPGFMLRAGSTPEELDLAPYAQDPRGRCLLEIAADRAAGLLPDPVSAPGELPSIAIIGIGLAIGVTAGLLII